MDVDVDVYIVFERGEEVVKCSNTEYSYIEKLGPISNIETEKTLLQNGPKEIVEDR